MIVLSVTRVEHMRRSFKAPSMMAAMRLLRVGFIAIMLMSVFVPYAAIAGHKPGVFREAMNSNHRGAFDSTSRTSGMGPTTSCSETDTNVGAIFVGPGCGGQSDGEPWPRNHW